MSDAVPADESARLVRLVGVYDADHTVRGEVTYWIGARLGRAHCALCDITHGMLRRRADWNAYVADLGVPFETYHRDDQPDEVRTAGDDRVPVVVAETSLGWVVLLDAAALDGCAGSVERLRVAVADALVREGLEL